MKNLNKNIIGLVVIITICGQLSAQQTFINVEWDLANGNPGTTDYVSSTLDPMGNLVYIGNDQPGTNSDIFLTCVHPAGNVLWQQTCTSSPTVDDYGADLKTDASGNIYVCAAYHNGSNYDYLVAKYSQAGNLIWQQFYNGTGNGDDVPSAIDIDPSGNIYVTGTSQGIVTLTDYATIKFDNNGNQQWVRRYDYNNLPEVATDIVVDNNGDILVLGASASSFVNFDFTVQKYSPNGTVLGTKRHNTPGNGYDLPSMMVVDAADNVYVIGTSESAGNKNIKIAAMDNNLTGLWVEYIDLSGNDDEGYGICLDPSGNVIVTGFCQKTSGGTDFIVAKYDNVGTQLWENSRTAPIDTDIAKGRQITTDAAGNIYATGEIQLNGTRDFSLMSFAPDGTIRFTKDFDINQTDAARQILVSNDTIFITGVSDSLGTKQTTTVKISVFDKNQPIVYCGIKPCAVDDEALVRFNPSDLILANVDNPKITWGIVSDFVKKEAIGVINKYVGFDIGQQKCYKVHPNLTSADTTSVSRLGNIVDLPPFYATFGVILPPGSDDSLVIQNLNASVPHVIVATDNGYAWLNLGANDPEYNNGNSAGLHPSVLIPNANINIEPAWDHEIGDSAIVIGIFDTGIHNSHNDLSLGTFATSSVKGGYDYINSAVITAVPNPDDYGHGTAVAGIPAGSRDNNFGVAGIAGGSLVFKGVSLHDMKIFKVNPTGCGITATFSATFAQIQQAIIEGSLGIGPITKQQDIQNHSWGGGLNSLIREAFITAYKNEIVSCVSSGNGDNIVNPCNVFSFPATFKDHMVMKVGANDSTGAKASFSECGWFLDFIAPGMHNLYTGIDNSGSDFTDSIQHINPSCPDQPLNGTSFAAPHAAGVVALMLSYAENNPLPYQFSHEDCEELMQRNTTDLTAPPNSPGYDDQTGWGRLNAGDLFDSIQYPKFRVEHYTATAPTNGAIQVGVAENTCLEISMFALPVGAIKANRFEVTANFTHTLPVGYNLITGWSRGSASDIAGINSGGLLSCIPTTCLVCDYMPDAADPAMQLPTLSPSGVTMTGYVYELLDGGLNPVGWWPYDTTSIATFAYSLYLVNPTVGIDEEREIAFNLFPNPANSTVTIQFGTDMQGETEIILTDLLGKLVKVIVKGENMASGQSISFTVDELSQGMYFVSLHNNEKQLTRKLLINK